MNTELEFGQVIPTTVKIEYGFECYSCGEKRVEEYWGKWIAMPSGPAGWRYVLSEISTRATDGVWVCPKHKVSVTITPASDEVAA